LVYFLAKIFHKSKPDEEDEAYLMSRIASGDSDAFQEILDLHMLAVYHFAYSILKDTATAEDITQETCIKLWKHSQSWMPNGRVRSWLFRIAHNLSIDEIRRRKPSLDIDNCVDSLSDQSQTGEERILESDISKSVKAALFQIPVRQRTALMLVYYSDFSNIEAAETMEVSVDALESLLSRGKIKLRELLKDQKNKLLEG
jgi:RNA polymerase sigma-70 factor, ECF subfamily